MRVPAYTIPPVGGITGGVLPVSSVRLSKLSLLGSEESWEYFIDAIEYLNGHPGKNEQMPSME